jgi:hypothetical protein
MEMETLGLLSFAFVATVLAIIAYMHNSDVLHGPYIQGRPGGFSLKRFAYPASFAVERLFWLEGQKSV